MASDGVSPRGETAGLPSLLPPIWKVSASWLRRRHDCTVLGILGRCGGACCRQPSYWPPSSYACDGYPTICGKLGLQGCTFTPRDRPVTCLLYPLLLNKNGMLVLHNRTTTKKGVCKGNHNNGPMLIDALKPSLVELFGEKQYKRVHADVIAGRDSYFEPSAHVREAYGMEQKWAKQNTKPFPRSSLPSSFATESPLSETTSTK